MNDMVRWAGVVIAAGGILVAATVYGVETRSMAKEAIGLSTALAEDVQEIRKDIKEILTHLRPYR